MLAPFFSAMWNHLDRTRFALSTPTKMALGLILLGIAGPSYRLGASLNIAFTLLRWGAYVGAAGAALGLIAVITFVLLFLMFGSVLVPAKALVLNLLSLSATFGALVWIFQDGNLAGLFNITSTGALDLGMPILIFCVAFGLSMDYEVFLLSRIKEEHDAGADNLRSVASGLERTGRIVTAAAVVISIVFVAAATSRVAMITMFGVGMTLAVLVDAFLVRSTLVPAFMRLAGDANWWAPGWMRALHRRFGLSETVPLDPPVAALETEQAPA